MKIIYSEAQMNLYDYLIETDTVADNKPGPRINSYTQISRYGAVKKSIVEHQRKTYIEIDFGIKSKNDKTDN